MITLYVCINSIDVLRLLHLNACAHSFIRFSAPEPPLDLFPQWPAGVFQAASPLSQAQSPTRKHRGPRPQPRTAVHPGPVDTYGAPAPAAAPLVDDPEALPGPVLHPGERPLLLLLCRLWSSTSSSSSSPPSAVAPTPNVVRSVFSHSRSICEVRRKLSLACWCRFALVCLTKSTSLLRIPTSHFSLTL